MVRVSHFQRKPRPFGNYSVESYFETIRSLTPLDIKIELKICRYESNGILKRLYNTFEASFRQSDVNHITGDVHFLNLLFRKKRTVLTILDCGTLRDSKGLVFLLKKLFWFTLPSAKAQYITVISEATKKDLLKYIRFDPNKIIVIYVSIPKLYKPYPKEFNASRPTILQIGTAQNKNLARLIEALSGISCTLVILGKLYDQYLDLLKKNNIDYINIEKLSTDQGVYELYKQCDIVSFVSTLEGFGMPIIEANAVGRVVLTSNVTSMPEIAGDAAHLIDPFDTNSIKNGFLKIMQDEVYRNKLIENGYQNIKRFDKKVIAQQYFDLYRSLASFS